MSASRARLLSAAHCFLLALGCQAVLGIEEPAPRRACAGVSCTAGASGAGNDAGHGAAGDDSTAGGNPNGGLAGVQMGPSSGEGGGDPQGGAGTADSSGGEPNSEGGSSALPGGRGGNGADGGAAGDAGAGGEIEAECVKDAVRCDGFQRQQCVAGQWLDVGDECNGFCQDGTCKSAPTCDPGASTNCSMGASCCDTIWIPGGTYAMAQGGGAHGYTRQVGGFYLDRFEVTVGRFARFLTNYALPLPGAGAHPRIPGSGWQEQWQNVVDSDHPEGTAVPANADEALAQIDAYCDKSSWRTTDGARPINCVNWYLAFAFCVFDGGRLPTEAEWNYAAAHGSDQLPYPWSESGSDTVLTEAHAAYTPFMSEPELLPPLVGSHPDGQGRFLRHSNQGHEDLAGSLFEWSADAWADPPAAACEAECMEPWGSTARRVTRGGSYDAPEDYLPSGFRSYAPADFIDNAYGFRCARDAQTSSENHP